MLASLKHKRDDCDIHHKLLKSAFVQRLSLFLLQCFLVQEDERLRLEVQAQRGRLELQGLQSHEVPWAQERAVLQQEIRMFRRNTIIFYMKLRWILMHWRLGCKDDAGEGTVHPEVSGRDSFQCSSVSNILSFNNRHQNFIQMWHKQRTEMKNKTSFLPECCSVLIYIFIP